MVKHKRINKTIEQLSKITGVPVSCGYNDQENDITAYGFVEPLSDNEIEEILKVYGRNVLAIKDYQFVAIRTGAIIS